MKRVKSIKTVFAGLFWLIASVLPGQADTVPILTTKHSDTVKSIAFFRDGSWFASAGGDGTVRLWDFATGRLLRVLTGHSDGVASAAISPDGTWIASVSEDRTVKIWDAASGKILRTLQIPSSFVHDVSRIFISPDGSTVGVNCCDNIFRWTVATGAPLPPIAAALRTGGSHSIWDLVQTADGKSLYGVGMVSLNGKIMQGVTRYDTSAGTVVKTFGTPTKNPLGVKAVGASPDGRLVATGDNDNVVRVWDEATGRLIRTLPHAEDVDHVEFSPDGSLLASSENTFLKIWNVQSGALLHSIKTEYSSTFKFSPDGKTIITGGDPMQLWSVETGTLVRPFDAEKGLGFPSVRGLPNNQWLVWSGEEWSTWDAGSGQLIRRGKFGFSLNGTPSNGKSLGIEPSGRMVGLSTGNRFVELRDGETGQLIKRFDWGSTSKESLNAALSPDGSRLAVTQSSLVKLKQSSIKVWSTGDNRPPFSFAGHLKYLDDMTFSPDGSLLISANKYDDSSMGVWSATDGRDLGRIKTDRSGQVFAISPDNRLVLTPIRSQGTWETSLWSIASKQVLRKVGLGGNVSTAVFSDDGALFATAESARVAIWETSSGRLLRTLEGNTSSVSALAFSKDGRLVTAVNWVGSSTTWSTATGSLLVSSFNAESGEWVTITPEGFFVASDKGGKLLHVVDGFKTIGIEQAYQSLYRPDLVREKLAGDPGGRVKEAAARLDLTKVAASGSAPRVGIVPPTSGAQVQGEQTTVEAEITDQGGGVGKVEWRVNGVTLGVEERGVKRADGSARSIKVSRTLGLTPGENKIAVLAYNEAGLIASELAEIVVTSVQQSGAKPRLHVLAVGVNDYWDSALRLSYAAPDARRLAESFRQAGEKLYEQVEVKTVLDGEATAAKLDAVFSELGKKVRPQDVFVFFLAGHGKTVDARFYFLPQDFRYTGEDSIVKKGVGQNQLQEWVSRIKAQKSVLLFDACESGSLVGDRIAMRGIEEKTAIDRMTRAMGRTVLTATTDSKPAIEGYRGHGVFTYTLLAGFNGADANADGVVDVTELATYVDRQLPDLTYDAFKLRQVPQMSIVGSNFPLASKVSLLPADGASPPPAAAAIPAKPTHFVIAPAEFHESPAGNGKKLGELPTGTAVSLVKIEQGWVLVARDGKAIGYVAEDRLVRIQ